MRQSKASLAAAHTTARAIPRKCCFPGAAPAADPAGRQESDSRRVRVRDAVRAIRTACKTIPKNAAPRAHRNASPAAHPRASRTAPLEQRHWPRARCPMLFDSVSNGNSGMPKTAACFKADAAAQAASLEGFGFHHAPLDIRFSGTIKISIKTGCYSYVAQCDKTALRSVRSDKVYTERGSSSPSHRALCYAPRQHDTGQYYLLRTVAAYANVACQNPTSTQRSNLRPVSGKCATFMKPHFS